MDLDSKIILHGSSVSPQRSQYSNNAGSPSNLPSSAPAQAQRDIPQLAYGSGADEFQATI